MSAFLVAIVQADVIHLHTAANRPIPCNVNLMVVNVR